MKIRELIEHLEEAETCFGPDTRVRFASQPSWPFEYSITDVVVCEFLEEKESGKEPDPVAYLVEGSQLGYLPGEVKDEIGW